MNTQMPTSNDIQESIMVASLRESADDNDRLDFEKFVNTVLYSPEYGYYSRERARVGRRDETDFYTAQSLGSIFGQLIVESCDNLLGKENLGKYTFVEIGAEPESSVLQGVDHSFVDTRTICVGDEIVIPAEAIVFANEWLDAQPFRRFRFDKKKGWVERGVEIVDGISVREIDLPETSPDAANYLEKFPVEVEEGYLLDLPTGADKALRNLCMQRWTGLFLTLDYGLNLRQFLDERPQGVARAYRRHRLSGNLLAHLGNQDITCHICWDALRNILEESGFSEIFQERQEAFFFRNAKNVIQKIITTKPNTFDKNRQTLMEILHPSNMGAKFHAFGGVREKRPRQIAR